VRKSLSGNIGFVIALLILASAFLFRVSWTPREGVPLKKELKFFPMKINKWEGTEMSLEGRILDVLGVSDYLMRSYISGGDSALNISSNPISLYVGFYETQNKGKTYHSPKNCLPGGGWELTTMETVPAVFSGVSHDVNKVIIQKGLEKQVVIYWFQDRGRIIASEYWAKIYLVLDSIMKKRSDGAFIRIIVPVVNTEESALKEGLLFAENIFPVLEKYLPG